MNTTKLGADFENKVFDYVSSLLDSEGFMGATKTYSRIFKHKKYKCAATKREIDFDITIETYNPHAKSKEWSSLIILECKNYSHKVDISDLDEFAAKINCISKSGIKGCMVSTIGYSKTEIEQARKDHIALAVFANNDMEWYTARNTHMQTEYLMDILLGKSSVGCMPVLYNDGNFVDLLDFLQKFGAAISEKNKVFIPYYKDETIKNKANELYKKCIFQTNDIAGEVLANIFPEIKIRFDNLNDGVLGMFSFEDRVVTLSNEIINDEHRRNFTLAHEIGHICLHESYIKDHAKNFFDYSLDKIKLLQDDLIKRMEQQANKFASFLLIPQERLLVEVDKLLLITNNLKGRFYLNSQIENVKTVDMVLKKLSEIFNVSKQVVKIRLIKEGLLIDDYRTPQRVNRILSRL
ncbi:MAG: ImmA/IrrE family metallo-endopeptidase [Bacteroidaceae bacterium]|nr:ImmA/IrrE family metallo-endopeptidase [Bacteroidaceae bacterium]